MNAKFDDTMCTAIVALTKTKASYLTTHKTVTKEEVDDYSQGGSQLIADEDGHYTQDDDRNWDIARYLGSYQRLTTNFIFGIYSIVSEPGIRKRLNQAISDYLTAELAKVWQATKTGIVVQAFKRAMIAESGARGRSRNIGYDRCLQ